MLLIRDGFKSIRLERKVWWIAEVERAPGRSATAISLPQPLVFLHFAIIFGLSLVSRTHQGLVSTL